MSHRHDTHPDALNLGDALGTIGRLLAASKAQFLSLVRDAESVVVEYIARDGKTNTETLNHYDLRKLQQSFYKIAASLNRRTSGAGGLGSGSGIWSLVLAGHT